MEIEVYLTFTYFYEYLRDINFNLCQRKVIVTDVED